MLCYAIYKLKNDKSEATSQLGYILLSLFSQIAKVTYVTINKWNIYHDYIFVSNVIHIQLSLKTKKQI